MNTCVELDLPRCLACDWFLYPTNDSPQCQIESYRIWLNKATSVDEYIKNRLFTISMWKLDLKTLYYFSAAVRLYYPEHIISMRC
jgi:hypothetical protein